MDLNWNPSPVEGKISLQFKRQELLRLALTHRSYAQQMNQPEENNDRLVYLGDAIANLIITEYLYHNCAYLSTAKLVALRDKMQESERLTKTWMQMGLESYPFLALKEERAIIAQKQDNPFADGIKALTAAIKCDRTYDQASKWLVKHLLQPTLASHLKEIKERANAEEHLRFLGDAVFKAVITDFLYKKLPHVNPKQLSVLYRELTSQERRISYLKQLTKEDWQLIPPEQVKIAEKSFKTFLAALYLAFKTQKAKSNFQQTANWFSEKLVDSDEILKSAINLLRKGGKSQKWIIQYVLGYPSKHYQEGRERFYEILGEKSEDQED